MISRSLKGTFYRGAGPLMRVSGWVYRTWRAPTSGQVKLHLGPGQRNYLPGWYNLDANFVTAKIDVWADLRYGLPFRDNTVDAIYSHHVIEHLPDPLLPLHFREMFRVLKPGGAIRVGGPDAETAAQKLVAGDESWFGNFPEKHESLGGKFKNFISCRGEHLTVLTYSYLSELASTAGFENVVRCSPVLETVHPGIFGEVLKLEYEPTPDMPHTLMIEAEKSPNRPAPPVTTIHPEAHAPPPKDNGAAAAHVVGESTVSQPTGDESTIGESTAGSYIDWGHTSKEPGCTWKFVLEPVLKLISAHPPPARVLDVGCGNGFLAGQLLQRGYRVVGVDLSESGIAVCRRTYPQGRFEVLAADDQVLQKLDEPAFDVVVSTEVIEHLYDPLAYAQGCYAALRPGGRFVCSTPYHGYLKNLVLALAGKWDNHANPLWTGGHIKFFSRETLSRLFTEVGFTNLQFHGAGRAPWLWMSMVMAADKPGRAASR